MNQAAIGSYIARKRKEKNLTQEQLAEHIGASNKTISKWENGKCMPDYSILQKLCNALHVTLPERMDGEDATEGVVRFYDDEQILDLLRRTQELEHQKGILCGVLLVVLGIACNTMSGMISGSEIQELISVLLVALSVAEISAGIFERNTDLHTVFGANLMWYLQFHVVCARLPLFVGIPKRGGCQTVSHRRISLDFTALCFSEPPL